MNIHFFWIGFRHVHFVRITIHFIWMGFCHVHVCTNDYPYYCISVFVMYISVQMTIHFFWIGFRHAQFCTDDYPFLLNWFSSCTFLYGCLPSHFEWIFVMHISVWMTTFSFWIDFRHIHFCTDDYLRTETCMTKIHSKWEGSHPYRNVHDENPLKMRI